MRTIAPLQDLAARRASPDNQTIVVGELFKCAGQHQTSSTPRPTTLRFHCRQPPFEPADIMHHIGESASQRRECGTDASLGGGGCFSDLDTCAWGAAAATLGNCIGGPPRCDAWLHARLFVVSGETLAGRELRGAEQRLAASVLACCQLLKDRAPGAMTAR